MARNPKRYDPTTAVFASNGFLDESLFNESEDPNVLLNKLQGGKNKRMSQLFKDNKRDKNIDMDNSSFGIHRINDTILDQEEENMIENVHVPETQSNNTASQKSYMDILPRNTDKAALSMRQLSPVNIDTDEDFNSLERKSSLILNNIPPPAQFGENSIGAKRSQCENVFIVLDSEPENGLEKTKPSSFKKPAFIPKPMPRNIVAPASSDKNLRRTLFKGEVTKQNDFTCSTPKNCEKNRHFDRTLVFSPISKSRAGAPFPSVISSNVRNTTSTVPRKELDQQEHHVSSSQSTPNTKGTDISIQRKKTPSSERNVSKVEKFKRINSKYVIASNLQQEIRIQDVYHTPKQNKKHSSILPAVSSSSASLSSCRRPIEQLEAPEDMELPVLQDTNLDVLMEVDQPAVLKRTAQKNKNKTHYESHIEETPIKSTNRTSLNSAAKQVKERLAQIEISYDGDEAVGDKAIEDKNISEDEAIGDKNISEDETEEIVGSQQVIDLVCETRASNIVTKLQAEVLVSKTKTLEHQEEHRRISVDNDNESIDSTDSNGARVDGLPLLPAFNRFRKSTESIENNFVLPAKKKKKSLRADQNTLKYLDLTNKVLKKNKDQSLGLSKRPLYSKTMDDSDDDLEPSTLYNKTRGKLSVTGKLDQPAPQSSRRDTEKLSSLPSQISGSASENEISARSLRSRCSNIEEMPEVVTEPIEVVQKQIIKKSVTKSSGIKKPLTKSPKEKIFRKIIRPVEFSSEDEMPENNSAGPSSFNMEAVESVNQMNNAEDFLLPYSVLSLEKISERKNTTKVVHEHKDHMTRAKSLAYKSNDSQFSDSDDIDKHFENQLPLNNLLDNSKSRKQTKKSKKVVQKPKKVVQKSKNKTKHVPKKPVQDGSSTDCDVMIVENSAPSEYNISRESDKSVQTDKNKEQETRRLLSEDESNTDGLRRSKREHKLTNMWWSSLNRNVRVRFGLSNNMKMLEEKKNFDAKQRDADRKPRATNFEKLSKPKFTKFSVCDQIVDEKFRNIYDPEKYLNMQLESKRNKSKEPSKCVDEDVSVQLIEKPKVSRNKANTTKPTKVAKQVKPHLPTTETIEAAPINKKRKKTSLLRGPRCKRLSISLENDDLINEIPSQLEKSNKDVMFISALAKIPTTSSKEAKDPVTWTVGRDGAELSSTEDFNFVDCGNGITCGRFYENSSMAILRFEPLALRYMTIVRDFPVTFLVLDGNMIFTIDENVVEARTGDCLRINVGQNYETFNSSKYNIAILQVTNDTFRSRAPFPSNVTQANQN